MPSHHSLLVLAVSIPFLLNLGCSPASGASATLEAPEYGASFWDHWGDGRAEVASYDLILPRYGESRKGTAVAIVVNEPFSASKRVKSDRGSDGFQVLKLNLVKDFATGVYDYNTMLSTFVALEDGAGLVAGQPVKVSYSSQEWCGHVYHQVRFDRDSVGQVSHSYFDGEADRESTLTRPANGLTEDGLWLWARGLASPLLQPGESKQVALLLSLQGARLSHRNLDWQTATLSRDAEPVDTTVPAGTFETSVFRVSAEGRPDWVFHVELDVPQRLIRWENSDGERGELVGSDRLPYWQLHGEGDERRLEGIGLNPRPARTP